jgi:pyruvate/2-oxoglutarate dehydrogenase complex dihydrolipoamide acyltransferase (E2) component
MTFRAQMKIKFLAGYRGPYTRNVYCPAGTEMELHKGYAAWLLDNGWALPVEVDVTQAAIDLALANKIPLAKVKGSGTDGRILVGDVEQAIEEASA